ncbi:MULTISPECIES: hypothetical protein [Aerococcus]|uniref:Uncharacterized protein n=2 Tax=Aerococcaceae TaxID=186827 RepID=A0A329N3Q5_9LACT|nr:MULTISPECIES: hypothetical protein [Aerococcus]MDL5183585.1 hypothetical protein [Aerococcus mictus]KAA9238420.1 hypothetical protein F6I34_08535 [Aerococcus urinae]MDK6372413.1 hypothetical protein [Aerococcus urinae]MDK6375844.1 hypothetical protein [Aerococcus urinae]MDK8075499.1 hypothetical protein [Aerococcus urinae]
MFSEKLNFEFLSDKDNKMLSERYNRELDLLQHSRITRQEAQYGYLTYIQKHWPEHAFEIYTDGNIL